MNTPLPNFIVSGFPKCGSTALHYYLNEHPEIFMPKQKELHFFTSDILAKQNKGPGDKEVKKTQIKTIDAYKKCFSDVRKEKAVGDASPSYINYPERFESIKKELNNPKVIILLRDPVKRAHSNYLHLVREHRETLDFYNALLEEPKRKELNYSDFWYYRFNSSYYAKILEAKRTFSDVLIITQEALNVNTSETIKQVFRFLGVDENFSPSNLNKRYNPGGSYKVNVITKFIFKQTPLKSMLKKLIPITPKMKHLKQKAIGKYKTSTPIIDNKSEDFLMKNFKEEVKNIETLGVDISHWNQNYFS